MKDVLAGRSPFTILLIYLVSAGGVFAFSYSPYYEELDHLAGDIRFYASSPPETDTTDQILHVDIDETALQEVGRWPWNRREQAQLVQILTSLGARQITLDILYLESQEENLHPQADESLARHMHSEFQSLLENVRQLKELQSTLPENEKPLTSEHRQILSSRISSLEQFANTGPDRLQSVLNQLEQDPDRQLQQAFQEGSRVILPFQMIPQSPWNRESIENQLQKVQPSSEETLDALLQLLYEHPNLSREETANRMDLNPDALEGIFRPVRNRAADRRIRSFLDNNEDLPPFETFADQEQLPASNQYLRRRYGNIRGKRLIRAKSGISPPLPGPRMNQLQSPLPELVRAARGLGNVYYNPDQSRGTMRTIVPAYRYKNHSYPELGLESAIRDLNIDRKEISIENGYLHLPVANEQDRSIPLNDQHQIVLNWHNAPWNEFLGDHVSATALIALQENINRLNNLYERLVRSTNAGGLEMDSLQDLVNQRTESLNGENPRNARVREREEEIHRSIKQKQQQLREARDRLPAPRQEEIKNRLARIDAYVTRLQDHRTETDRQWEEMKERVENTVSFVGVTATGGVDLHPTPVHSAFPGVSRHSLLYHMIAENAFLEPVSPLTNGLLILLGAVPGVLLAIPGAVWMSSLLMLAVLAGFSGINIWFFLEGTSMELVGFSGSLLLSYGLMSLYNQFFIEAARRKTRKLFERYVDPDVVEEILAHSEDVSLGGDRRVVTMMFLDIARFTAISENLEPEKVADLTTRFLSAMTEEVFKRKGTLDKYQGDAVIAFWGAPLEQWDQREQACETALACLQRLEQLNQTRPEEIDPLEIRIGLHTGSVIAGNLGSKQHSDYTVLGDNVNVAARLEGANKFFKTDILISQDTRDYLPDPYTVRELGTVLVKGKEEMITVFELVGTTSDLSPEQAQFLDHYGEGISFMKNSKWKPANLAFENALEIRDDHHTRTLLNRVQLYMDSPPEPGNELIFDLRS